MYSDNGITFHGADRELLHAKAIRETDSLEIDRCIGLHTLT